jgi:hypothetical protein
MEETIKSTTLDVDAVQTGDTSDTKFGILTPTVESYLPLTWYQKDWLQEKQKAKKQIMFHAIVTGIIYILYRTCKEEAPTLYFLKTILLF